MSERSTANSANRGVRLAIALVLLASAGFACFVAVISYVLLCDENCTGRTWELSVQLVVALIGLAIVAGATYLVAVNRWPAARTCLIIAFAIFAGWAVLLDAATHGWGHGPVPF